MYSFRSLERTGFDALYKAFSTDISCTSITDFLASRSIPLRGNQFEMIRKIRA
jgi:hypothetical protein